MNPRNTLNVAIPKQVRIPCTLDASPEQFWTTATLGLKFRLLLDRTIE